MLLQLPLIGLLPDWLTFALGVVDLVIRVAVLGIIPGNRRPTTAMAWLLAIFFIPTLGLLVFLLFGNFRFSGRRRDQQQEVNARVRAALADSHDVDTTFPGPEWLHSAAALNRGLGSLPMVNGNRVRLIPGYEDAIAEMTEAVRGAKRFVNAEFYIVSWDEVTEDFFTALTSTTSRPRWTSPFESANVFPCSEERSSASSSMCSLARSTNVSRIRPRRCGFIAAHSAWPFSALAMASRTSSRLASGSRAWTSPVQGL